VGLRRCSEDLRTQVREIVDLGREEMTRLAIDVPLSVGFGALEHGDNGAGLALRMLSLLGEMAIDATQHGGETALAARSHASSGLFMLLRQAAEGL
jgi:hypothetical protein